MFPISDLLLRLIVFLFNDLLAAIPPGGEIAAYALRAPAVLPRLLRDFNWHNHDLAAIGLLVASFTVLPLIYLRSRAENRLRNSEARMNLAIRAAELGLWDWDIPRNRIWATPECRQLYGIGIDESIDFQRFVHCLHPDDREPTRRVIERALAEAAEYRCEYRVCKPDGSVRWLTAQGRATYDGKGRPLRLLGLSMDITERKQAEQELQQQRVALTHVCRVSTLAEISTTLAHELNQPLSAILGNAQAARRFLAKRLPDDDELFDILNDIAADAERAGEVIHRLRALYRKVPLPPEPLSLNALIEGVAKLLRGDLIARHVSLVLDLAADLPPASGDPVQLQQVLLNLLINAADAVSAAPGFVHRIEVISRRQDAENLQVAVRDNGRGIALEDLEQVFDAFVTTKPHGLGMGLAISRSIIAAHGGRLWAENYPEGGAVLRFTLPTCGQEPL